jgi:protein phosphatase 1L
VDGQLVLARSFGDKGQKEHMSAKPDVSDLVIDLSCDFLVSGSNGLFSMLENQEIVDRVEGSDDPVKAAHNLVLATP